jgi:hypothetical protein
MGLLTSETATAFADIVCADSQWVRDEFDALIAASFGRPPMVPPPAPPAIPRRPRRYRPAGRGRHRIPALRARWFREHGHRQRSPPA